MASGDGGHDVASLREELAEAALAAAAELVKDAPDHDAVARYDARAAELRAEIKSRVPEWRVDLTDSRVGGPWGR